MINLSYFSYNMPNALNPYDRAVKKVVKTIDVCNNIYLDPCNAAHRSGEFLPRLWCILNEPALTHIIAWADDGVTFRVSNKQAFEKHVLPYIYKATKLTSFYRQLRLYGFKRLGSLQEEVTSFTHREFTRNTSVNMLYNVERLDFLSRNKRRNEPDKIIPETFDDIDAGAPPHLPYMSAPSATTFISRVSIGGYAVPHQPVTLPTPITALPIMMVHAPTPRGLSAQSPILLNDDYEPDQDTHSNTD